MNSPDHLPYGIDKNRLRTGVAVGVLVIAAGLGFGSVMQTSSSSAEEPTAPVIDNAPGTDADSGDAASTSSTPTGLGNDQPVADKGTVIAESSPSETDDAASKTNATQDEDADKTDAESSESSQDDVVDVAVEIEATEDAQDTAADTADEDTADEGIGDGEAEPDATDDDTADEGETDGVEEDEDSDDDDASDDDASEDDDAKGKGKGLGLGNGLALGLGNGNGNGHGLGLLYPGSSLDELPPPSELDLPTPIDPPGRNR
jgi:hypothetical protein